MGKRRPAPASMRCVMVYGRRMPFDSCQHGLTGTGGMVRIWHSQERRGNTKHHAALKHVHTRKTKL